MNPKQAVGVSVEAWVSKIWHHSTRLCKFFHGNLAPDVALLKISKDMLIPGLNMGHSST